MSVSWPKAVKLQYNSVEYEAKSVACGPTYTCVIGTLKHSDTDLSEHKSNLQPFEPARKALRKMLLEKKSLAWLFQKPDAI